MNIAALQGVVHFFEAQTGLSSLSVSKCSDFGISDAVAAIIWDEAFESTAKKNKLRRCIRAESKIVNILPKAQNNTKYFTADAFADDHAVIGWVTDGLVFPSDDNSDSEHELS